MPFFFIAKRYTYAHDAEIFWVDMRPESYVTLCSGYNIEMVYVWEICFEMDKFCIFISRCSVKRDIF